MPTAHFKYAVGISYFCISVFFRFGMSEISRSAKASSFGCGSSFGSVSTLRKNEKKNGHDSTYSRKNQKMKQWRTE